MKNPFELHHTKIDQRITAGGVILLLATALLFARLGHYALWDDEANTALFAEGICATGDTSALIGHNLVAYEGGWELKNLHERFIPPLPAYLDAASFSILGETALAARVPFAICGVAFFALALFWLYRDVADPWTFSLLSFALITNVSLLLYFRQARYYGAVIVLTSLLVYWYMHWSNSLPKQLFFVLTAFALFSSNYISFGALFICFGIDCSLWGRKQIRLSPARAALLIGLLAIAMMLLLFVYNPFNHEAPPAPAAEGNKFLQAWWDLRDLSVNEFCIIPLLLLVPVVSLWRHDVWLLRGSAALVIYFVTILFVEPHHSSFAALRYFAPLIPLCAVLQVRALVLAMGRYRWLAIVLGVPIIGTNLLSGSTIFHPGLVGIPLRSTLCSYIGELVDPPSDPYHAASDWINKHLPNDATVLALPRYTSYPLMFHAPGQVYAWQLTDPADRQFKTLPDIHFTGRAATEFLIAFGRDGLSLLPTIRLKSGVVPNYTLVAALPILGKDLYRPELYCHLFTTPRFDARQSGIYIFEKH